MATVITIYSDTKQTARYKVNGRRVNKKDAEKIAFDAAKTDAHVAVIDERNFEISAAYLEKLDKEKTLAAFIAFGGKIFLPDQLTAINLLEESFPTFYVDKNLRGKNFLAATNADQDLLEIFDDHFKLTSSEKVVEFWFSIPESSFRQQLAELEARDLTGDAPLKLFDKNGKPYLFNSKTLEFIGTEINVREVEPHEKICAAALFKKQSELRQAVLNYPNVRAVIAAERLFVECKAFFKPHKNSAVSHVA